MRGGVVKGRHAKERMEKALEQLKTISEDDYRKVKTVAAIVKPLRSVHVSVWPTHTVAW